MIEFVRKMDLPESEFSDFVAEEHLVSDLDLETGIREMRVKFPNATRAELIASLEDSICSMTGKSGWKIRR